MHFRILKMISTSGLLTALECTKFVFGRDSTPKRAGGVYIAPSPVSWFKRVLLLRGGKGREEKGERREEGK